MRRTAHLCTLVPPPMPFILRADSAGLETGGRLRFHLRQSTLVCGAGIGGSTRGLTLGINPDSNPGADAPARARAPR
jgi:hypothetical protein